MIAAGVNFRLRRRPVRVCSASGWLVTRACVDRLGKGIECCPHCSAPVRCQQVDVRDVLIPPHRPLPAVLTKGAGQ